MKTKKVNRYYCEHCKKSGCNAGHIKEHERKCCQNPGRVCEVCGTKSRDYADLVKKFEASGDVEDLGDMVDGCPYCILAVILQSQNSSQMDRTWEWDFSAAKSEWFNARIREEIQADSDRP
jgi:hypothetical protein